MIIRQSWTFWVFQTTVQNEDSRRQVGYFLDRASRKCAHNITWHRFWTRASRKLRCTNVNLAGQAACNRWSDCQIATTHPRLVNMDSKIYIPFEKCSTKLHFICWKRMPCGSVSFKFKKWYFYKVWKWSVAWGIRLYIDSESRRGLGGG